MKLMNMTKLAFSNLKGNKGKTIIIVIILSLCLIAYVFVNCVTFSVQKFTEDMIEYKGARALRIEGVNATKENMKKLLNVSAIFKSEPNNYANIFDSTFEFEKTPYKDNYGILLTGYFDNIVPEVIAGENIIQGQRNVGLIPDYFQPDMDCSHNSFKKDTIPFLDGRELIGENITIKYYCQLDNTKPGSAEGNYKEYSYTFKVIGVYEALEHHRGFDSVFVPMDDLKVIHERKNPDLKDTYNKIGVVVDKFSNISKVEEAVTEMGLFTNKTFDPSPMVGISQLWTRASQIISMIILLFLIIGTYMIVSMNIKKRKSEVAVLKSFGYKESTIISNFILEGIITSLISSLISIAVTAVVLLIFWKPILKSLVSLTLTTMEISLSNYLITVGIGSLFCILISILGILFASKKIFKIEPSEALKM